MWSGIFGRAWVLGEVALGLCEFVIFRLSFLFSLTTSVPSEAIAVKDGGSSREREVYKR